jgi:hypothetical protein
VLARQVRNPRLLLLVGAAVSGVTGDPSVDPVEIAGSTGAPNDPVDPASIGEHREIAR